MSKQSATPVWIVVNSPVGIPVPVGTEVDITIGWQSTEPAGAGTNYLNVVVDDGQSQAFYPVGVMPFGQNITVQHLCTHAGMTTVTVRENLARKGSRFTDMGAYTGFAVQ